MPRAYTFCSSKLLLASVSVFNLASWWASITTKGISIITLSYGWNSIATYLRALLALIVDIKARFTFLTCELWLANWTIISTWETYLNLIPWKSTLWAIDASLAIIISILAESKTFVYSVVLMLDISRFANTLPEIIFVFIHIIALKRKRSKSRKIVWVLNTINSLCLADAIFDSLTRLTRASTLAIRNIQQFTWTFQAFYWICIWSVGNRSNIA